MVPTAQPVIADAAAVHRGTGTSSHHAAANGDLLFNHPVYKREKLLGKGAFGEVILATNKRTGEQVAIKLAKLASLGSANDPVLTRYLQQEILNQRTLKHPHVIEFKEVFAVGKYVGIAMEYAAGGSLFTLVQNEGRLTESKARWFFQQLCMTLDFCHKKQVAHRDIKLENLLLKHIAGVPTPLLKMADFGFSKVMDTGCMTRVGTLSYMAPEVVTAAGAYDGHLADVWSCGVVLYVMLVGQYPFGAPGSNERDKKVVMEKVLNADYKIPEGVAISAEGCDLLRRILQPHPSRRLTMEQVMAHPWFLQDLPAGALEYNRTILQQPVNETLLQSVADIQAALDSAQRA